MRLEAQKLHQSLASSSLLFVAAMTALMKADRTPASSSFCTAVMVVPAMATLAME